MRRLLLVLMLVVAASATIQLVTPKHVSLESLDEIEIAPVGPGHEVFLKFQRSVSSYIWDKVVLTNVVDSDWDVSTYNDYEYIYVTIKVPANKQSGKYTFQFEISDDQGLKDSETALVSIMVTHDQSQLIDVRQMAERFSGYAAESTPVTLVVENRALSRVAYEISYSVKEMPSMGSHNLTHQFESGETASIQVPVFMNQEGEYIVNMHVWSKDNPTIDQRRSTKVIIKPTFASKLKSIGQGFPLVPMTMAPFYAFLGIFGW